VTKKDPEPNALLEEYAASVQHMNALATSSWQSTSIFLATTLAGTVFVANREPDSEGELAIVWVFSMGAFIVLTLWMLMVRRFVYFQAIEQHRILEIEVILGFRRVQYLVILENWDGRATMPSWRSLRSRQKASLETLRMGLMRLRLPFSDRFRLTLGYAHTSTLTYLIGALVAFGWLALAVLQTYRFLSGDFDATESVPRELAQWLAFGHDMR